MKARLYFKNCGNSGFVISKGCNVLEVSNSDNFIDLTLSKVEYDAEHIFLRAIQKGKPQYSTYTLDGATYKTIKVGKHLYIPKKITH